jgi:transcription initiation factor IIF auxiliary subunit
MSLSFDRQVIKDPKGRIKYKLFSRKGREHYHIGIWLDGEETELDQVEKIEYELHQTFKNPLRSSSNRDNKFSITIWTWGQFNIRATIYYKNGETEERQFYLDYDLPPDDGENYVLV